MLIWNNCDRILTSEIVRYVENVENIPKRLRKTSNTRTINLTLKINVTLKI